MSVGPVSAFDAVLAIPEVDDSTTGHSKSQARKLRHEMLDQVEQLWIVIVGGVEPRIDLERIAASILRQWVRTDDPSLELDLDRIEMWARFELAKLDCDL